MSVRFHEAVSFDSTKYRLDWREDFWGDSIDARWTVATVGGSNAVVDAQDNGVLRMLTGGTTNDANTLYWNNIRSLHVNKKLTVEYRVKLNSTTAVDVILSWRYDANERIYFQYRSSTNANWLITTIDGGAPTQQVTGNAADTSFHIFKIECFPTGELHFYIDNTECANSPLTTNIPDDAADYLQPWFTIQTLEDVAKSMDIDYVYVRQDR